MYHTKCTNSPNPMFTSKKKRLYFSLQPCGGSVAVEFLFIVTPIAGVCDCSSFAIILMGKRELFALLSLSSWCLVMVVWLFLAVPWVCLRFVIVVFPDHTHLLF